LELFPYMLVTDEARHPHYQEASGEQ